MSRGAPTVRECPGCGETVGITVYETRRSTNGTIRRRCDCPTCGARWRSREAIEEIIRDPNRGMRAFDWSI